MEAQSGPILAVCSTTTMVSETIKGVHVDNSLLFMFCTLIDQCHSITCRLPQYDDHFKVY